MVRRPYEAVFAFLFLQAYGSSSLLPVVDGSRAALYAAAVSATTKVP
jgi:hypothetical protein